MNWGVIKVDVKTDNVNKSIITCDILGVKIAVTNMRETLLYIQNNLSKLKGNYICISNVHTTVMSYENASYCSIQNSGALALPDGKPLSVVSKLRGYKSAQRVTGPDLMGEIFRLSEFTGYSHFFYGSTKDTINTLAEKLIEHYPKLKIVGLHSPPYNKEVSTESDDFINKVNEIKPDFFWVGLGAPKQEKWMSIHKGKINTVMVGVGAGFDYHAEKIKRAPMWMQKLSMEWLYRLSQDPWRLAKRYIITNSKFMFLICIKRDMEKIKVHHKKGVIYTYYGRYKNK
jgi:N-acetylglucosaminyldiphosphoundecaprenol N-acetyl-beta-D-mannosaminyltransferase